MKAFELSTLTRPLSEGDPCGPDLEAADDDEYLNVFVTTETVLPPEYFVFSDYIGARQPFDLDRRYSDLDIGALVRGVGAFVERTHDLRLNVLLAKLLILAKDLAGAEFCVEACAVLLETQWDAVHPRVEHGGETLRRDVLQRLDDTLIVTALQHVPLFTSKRHGAITWHRYTTELRKAAGGAGDDTQDLDRSLADENQTDLAVLSPARDELARTRETLRAFEQALKRIGIACQARMTEGAPNFPMLGQLVERLYRFVDRIARLVEAAVVRLDPGAAREPVAELPADLPAATARDEAGGPSAAPAFARIEDAAAALAAVVGYFERAEPSNPALLLLRQAQGLIGKSFFDAMQILLPDHAGKALLEIGTAKTFSLPLSRLAGTGAPESMAPGPMDGALEAWPALTTRADAVAILDQVGAFFRRTEPSSPIPMLTDGARGLTGKDFMTLLGDVLPKDVLKAAASK